MAGTWARLKNAPQRGTDTATETAPRAAGSNVQDDHPAGSSSRDPPLSRAFGPRPAGHGPGKALWPAPFAPPAPVTRSA